MCNYQFPSEKIKDDITTKTIKLIFDTPNESDKGDADDDLNMKTI
jgi:hypothetical protein